MGVKLASSWYELDLEPIKFNYAKEQKKERILTDSEIRLLVVNSIPPLKYMILIALNTGMRKSEILTLTWDQVDLKHGFIFLTDTKNDERREIPINQTLRDALESLTRHISSPYVYWQGEGGERYKDVRRNPKA